MTAKKRARISTETYRHSGIIYGPVRIIHPAIQRAGVPWQYDHGRHAYLIPVQHLGEVEAHLIADGYRVDARGGALL